MNKQRMIRMLTIAKEAIAAVELITFNARESFDSAPSAISEGTQNLIGQLILASAIEESGSSVSMSIDKLDDLARALSEVAVAIKQH